MSGEQAAMPQVEDRATPERIARMVVQALRDCPAVGRVALFGSLASGEHDGLSDVDLIAEVADENGAWTASEALGERLPVQYRRTFTGFSAPSCRHWLAEESPLHQVDLSFDTPGEFDAKVRDGIRGHALTTRLVLDRAPAEGAASAKRWSIPVDERDATAELYPALKHMKTCLRGLEDLEPAREAVESFRRTVGDMTTTAVGGDLRGLAVAMDHLWLALLEQRRQKGSVR